MEVTILPEHFDGFVSRAQSSGKTLAMNDYCTMCALRIALEPTLLEEFPDFWVGGFNVYAKNPDTMPTHKDMLLEIPYPAIELISEMDRSIKGSTEQRETVRSKLPQTFNLRRLRYNG